MRDIHQTENSKDKIKDEINTTSMEFKLIQALHFFFFLIFWQKNFGKFIVNPLNFLHSFNLSRRVLTVEFSINSILT